MAQNPTSRKRAFAWGAKEYCEWGPFHLSTSGQQPHCAIATLLMQHDRQELMPLLEDGMLAELDDLSSCGWTS